MSEIIKYAIKELEKTKADEFKCVEFTRLQLAHYQKLRKSLNLPHNNNPVHKNFVKDKLCHIREHLDNIDAINLEIENLRLQIL